MSKTGPPVDLARGDRVGLFRVLTILGHGEEGVAATVLDEFLQIERVLKAYPAEAFWVDRLKFVSSAFLDLAQLGVCPAPIVGGVEATSRGKPVAYLVVEKQIGRPLDVLMTQAWSERRAIACLSKIARKVARVHLAGWSLGDFEAGNNIVLIRNDPVFVDLGLDRDAFVRPPLTDDFECLADVARRLAEQSGSAALHDVAVSLAERAESRLTRRSLNSWLKRSKLAAA